MSTDDIIKILGAIATIITAIGGYYLGPGSSPTPTPTPTPPTPTSTTGSISASSSPSGASIYLDGSYQGIAPMTIRSIEAGSHIITLKYTGYQDWSQTISVRAGDVTYVSPLLISEPTPTSTITTSQYVTTTTTTYNLAGSWVYPTPQNPTELIALTADGRFGVSDYDTTTGYITSGGGGYYQLSGSTLTFTYTNGGVKVASFMYIDQNTIEINSYRYVRYVNP